MHAHSQFCLSGDFTLKATRHAIEEVSYTKWLLSLEFSLEVRDHIHVVAFHARLSSALNYLKVIVNF